MGKVIQFPTPNPEKFGFKPVRKKKRETSKYGQMNLFAGGKIVHLNKLSVFEEALLLDEQNDDQARKQYLKAIEAGDSVADAYCNLGILESELKDHSKAIDCFNKCLKEDPRHFEGHYNLANIYAEIGNFPLAKIHYQISIEIEPSFPNSYFNLGLSLAMLQEIEAAIQSLLHYKSWVSLDDRSQVDELISNLSRTMQ